MLRTPVMLGMSMGPRKNRRLFVAVTYALLVAVIVALMIVLSRLGRIGGYWWPWVVVLAYNVVSLGVFGKLVESTVLPVLHGGQMTSLGLAPKRRDKDEPDEREVAVRNAAYFEAYRVLAVYGVILWMFFVPGLQSLSGSTTVLFLRVLAMPLLTMALTLPQAIILWTEPDVPEEAKV